MQKTLNLNDKGIKNILSIYNMVENIESIEILNLQNNKIEDLDGIQRFKSLREIDLTNNDLINIDILLAMNLQKIDVSNNKIKKIKIKKKNQYLRELIIINNFVEDIQNISYLGELKKLCLASNNITSILGKNNIKELDLANNRIVDPKFISDFPNLEKLYISDNFFEQINISTNKFLKEVDLSNNHLSKLDVLKLPINLLSLDIVNSNLDKNKIKSIITMFLNLDELMLSMDFDILEQKDIIKVLLKSNIKKIFINTVLENDIKNLISKSEKKITYLEEIDNVIIEVSNKDD